MSTKAQDLKSQEPDLKRWAAAHDQPVRWYPDKATGKTMNRPGWKALEQAIDMGQVSTVVCWRIDRLGCTASGLTALFDKLQGRKVNLVSLRDGLDLSTPAGRLMANMLASVAAFETEVRASGFWPVLGLPRPTASAGAAASPGVAKRVTPTQERAIKAMREQGENITAIALATGLARPTVYSILRGTVRASPAKPGRIQGMEINPYKAPEAPGSPGESGPPERLTWLESLALTGLGSAMLLAYGVLTGHGFDWLYGAAGGIAILLTLVEWHLNLPNS